MSTEKSKSSVLRFGFHTKSRALPPEKARGGDAANHRVLGEAPASFRGRDATLSPPLSKLARLRYSIARQSERTYLPCPASRSNIVVDADALIIVSHSQPPSLFRILAGCGSGSPTRIATLPLLLYC
jgi:hypothetical protein